MYHFAIGGARAKGAKMMNSKENSGNVMTAESYRNMIIGIVEKMQPEHLKRIYKFVSYLYIWR